MKQTPQEKKIQDRMKPGILTLDGFLGNDTRHLNDIIATDRETLDKLKITQEEIADRMDYFTQKAFENYDGAIIIDDKFEIEYRSVRGRVICPFPEPGSYLKGFIKLINLKNGITLTWTPLTIHMIKKHGFFEGKGSANRLEPGVLAKALF